MIAGRRVYTDEDGVVGGEPVLQKTVIGVEAEANVSIRLVPGQDDKMIAAEMVHAFAVRDGQIVWNYICLDKEEAIQAARSHR